MLVYAVVDLRSSPDHPLGDAVETFLRREDAERFIEEVYTAPVSDRSASSKSM